MPIPHPFHNEFITGHLARIVASSDFFEPSQLLKDLQIKVGMPHKTGMATQLHHRLLARALGLPERDYLSKHSINTSGKPWSTQVGYFLKSEISGVEKPKQDLLSSLPCKFCPNCRTEDVAAHGCGFWHREHQFAGLYTCLTHGTPLRRCAPDVIFRHPLLSEVEGEEADMELVEASSVPVLLLYWKISLALLDANNDPSDVERRKLCAWSAMTGELGSGFNNLRWTQRVPHYVADVLPERWLLAHFGKSVAQRVRGKPITEGVTYWQLYPRTRKWSDPYRRGTWSIDLTLLCLCAVAANLEQISGLLLSD